MTAVRPVEKQRRTAGTASPCRSTRLVEDGRLLAERTNPHSPWYGAGAAGADAGRTAGPPGRCATACRDSDPAGVVWRSTRSRPRRRARTSNSASGGRGVLMYASTSSMRSYTSTRQDRAEDLLLHDLHPLVDVQHQRRGILRQREIGHALAVQRHDAPAELAARRPAAPAARTRWRSSRCWCSRGWRGWSGKASRCAFIASTKRPSSARAPPRSRARCSLAGVEQLPISSRGTARPRSTSAFRIAGDLPPSSSVTGVRLPRRPSRRDGRRPWEPVNSR